MTHFSVGTLNILCLDDALCSSDLGLEWSRLRMCIKVITYYIIKLVGVVLYELLGEHFSHQQKHYIL